MSFSKFFSKLHHCEKKKQSYTETVYAQSDVPRRSNFKQMFAFCLTDLCFALVRTMQLNCVKVVF